MKTKKQLENEQAFAKLGHENKCEELVKDFDKIVLKRTSLYEDQHKFLIQEVDFTKMNTFRQFKATLSPVHSFQKTMGFSPLKPHKNDLIKSMSNLEELSSPFKLRPKCMTNTLNN